MNSPELMRAAHERGVATSYRASGGREVTVALATIETILAELGRSEEHTSELQSPA